MSKCHLVIPDPHAHPQHDNERATLLGNLIKDLKPDVVINLGDTADMPSLSSFDKGTKAFVGRNYSADINSHLDFQDKMWSPVRRTKRKLPRRVVLEGNHEHRIRKVVNSQPEFEGTGFGVSFDDLDLKYYYDDVVEYEGNYPGVITIDGIQYAHFFLTGTSGRPISGEHTAHSLISKRHTSSTCGHIHILDYHTGINGAGDRLHGLVAGVYQDYHSDWAGRINDFWWSGVVIKRNIDGKGNYDPQFVSLDYLRKYYAS